MNIRSAHNHLAPLGAVLTWLRDEYPETRVLSYRVSDGRTPRAEIHIASDNAPAELLAAPLKPHTPGNDHREIMREGVRLVALFTNPCAGCLWRSDEGGAAVCLNPRRSSVPSADCGEWEQA